MQHWAKTVLKEARHIILQTGTDHVVWETSIVILGKLPQLKQYVRNILPSCKVSEFRPRMDTD